MESQSNWGNSMWNVTSDHFKNSLSNYHLVKNDNKYWLFHKSDESFNAWIDKNATHVWEIDGDPLRQGYYLNRSGKKELVFGSYCDNK